MTSEIIICPTCKTEKVLNYGGKFCNDDEVTFDEKCRCSKRPLLINGKKILDHALMIIKHNEVQNEKSNRGISKLPKRSSSNSEK